MNASSVSSAVLTPSAPAVGASFTAVTVTVAVAVADHRPLGSLTWNPNVASPFQFPAGVNARSPRAPCSISCSFVTAVPSSANSPCADAGSVTTFTAVRLSPASTSPNTPSNCAAVNASSVSSAVLTPSASAVGASFTAVTVTVAVAVADSRPLGSLTWNPNVASPFQFPAGVNARSSRSAFSISWFAVTAVPSSASSPCADAGSFTTFTDFRLSPESTSPNTPSNCAAVNASAVSSAVLAPSAPAVGASFTAVTVTVAVAVADHRPLGSLTWNPNVASPFQFPAGVNASVPKIRRARSPGSPSPPSRSAPASRARRPAGSSPSPTSGCRPHPRR